jgi:hypothetical protein
MFHASHSFLSIASARMQSTKQAFTSYSEKLGDLLVKTHEFVLLSIEADFGEADIVEQKFKVCNYFI